MVGQVILYLYLYLEPKDRFVYIGFEFNDLTLDVCLKKSATS